MQMNTLYAIGAALAILHGAMIFRIVRLIVSGKEPDWPMYWMLPTLLDLPVSLLFLIAMRLLCRVPKTSPSKPTSLLADTANFSSPLVFLGIGGTVWWFFVPTLVVHGARQLSSLF